MKTITVTDRERWAAFLALYATPWQGTDEELTARAAAAESFGCHHWESCLRLDGQVMKTPDNDEIRDNRTSEVQISQEAIAVLLDLIRKHPSPSSVGRAKARLIGKLKSDG